MYPTVFCLNIFLFGCVFGQKNFQTENVFCQYYYKKIKYYPEIQPPPLLEPIENLTEITYVVDNKKIILDEGSFCKRSFDNRPGYCLVSYKCLHVLREYRKHGVKIDVCTYKGKIPIICCPLEDKNLSSLEYSIKKSVSALKCDEYNGQLKWKEDYVFPKYNLNNVTKCEPSVPLIVGGEITFPGEFPHMAAIGWRKLFNVIHWACGGTLISERFVLTAAHCTNLRGKKPDVVKFGENNLKSKLHHQYNISNIYIHPKYNISLYYHDIALIKLNKIVILTKFIRPACLWQKSEFNFQYATATGWGKTKFLGSKSDDLLKINLKIIDKNLCKKLYKNDRKLPNGILNDIQFCAGYLNDTKDTCQGDSGGPLQINIIKTKCIYFIIGITSFGKLCAAKDSVGVYVKVYPYLDWIENIVFKNSINSDIT